MWLSGHVLLVALSVLLIEPIVRVARPQSQLVRDYVAIDPDIGPVSRANADYYDTKGREKWGYDYHVRTNNLGLRMNYDVSAETAESERRVLFLGNSIVFGWGNELDNTFYGHLYENFRKQDTTVMNGGYGTYSTGHCRKFAKRLLARVDISNIVSFLSAGDMRNNLRRSSDYQVYRYDIKDGGQVNLNPVKVFSPWKRWLYMHSPYSWLNRHSHAFVYFKKFLKQGLSSAGDAVDRAITMAATPDSPEDGGDSSESVAMSESGTPDKKTAQAEIQVEYTGGWNKKELKKAWLVTRAHLRAFKNMCRENGSDFVIVWLPSSREFLTGKGSSGAEMLKRRLRESFGTAFIDTVAECADETDGLEHTDLFYGDWHWKPKTNRIFADSLEIPLAKRINGHNVPQMVKVSKKHESGTEQTNN